MCLFLTLLLAHLHSFEDFHTEWEADSRIFSSDFSNKRYSFNECAFVKCRMTYVWHVRVALPMRGKKKHITHRVFVILNFQSMRIYSECERRWSDSVFNDISASPIAVRMNRISFWKLVDSCQIDMICALKSLRFISFVTKYVHKYLLMDNDRKLDECAKTKCEKKKEKNNDKL